MAWHRERSLSPAALAFIEAARSRPRRLSVVGRNARYTLGLAVLGLQPIAESLAV
jgi:hypothetical protein